MAVRREFFFFYKKEIFLPSFCWNKKHFIEIFQSAVTKIHQQKFTTNDSETTMGNFKMVSEVIQKDTKSSVILPGLLAYNRVCIRHLSFAFPAVTWTPGTLLLWSRSLVHRQRLTCFFQLFTDITNWTWLMQDNSWNIFLLLLGRRLALLIHQCSIETVLHGRLESLLHFK